MIAFAKIRQAAEKRLGRNELARRLPQVKSSAELKKLGDDRYLSLMSLRIFRAGLRHDMVDAKWPAFEEVFLGFEPKRVRAMSDEAIERLMSNPRLIRHLGKLRSVQANAAALCDIAAEQGSFGAWLAEWPTEDVVGLWDALAKRCSQLGGNSGAYFLRMAGKDTFIPTSSVVAALLHWGALEAEPKGRAGRGLMQALFNAWRKEAGMPLAHLSMTLAVSVD